MEKEARVTMNIDSMRKSNQMIDAYRSKLKKDIEQIRKDARSSFNTSFEKISKENYTTL